MKIGVCTPSRSSYVHHDHMGSLIDTLRLAGERKHVQILHFLVPGCSLITRARNRLVAVALEHGCDRLFFIDDDIGWNADDFLRLVDYDVDVVAAAPARRAKHWRDEPLAIMRLGPKKGPTNVRQVRFPNGGRIWQAEGVATAFLCVKASVFKEIEPFTEPFFSDDNPNRYQTRTWFWIDLVTLPETGDRLHDQGEDYNFCWKWRAAGGDCFVDPDVRLRHYDGNVCHDYCPADMEIRETEPKSVPCVVPAE